jgi:uncharacterized protein with NRDE domain
MCLVAVAVRSHPRYPIVLVGNRDEWHTRPAAAADWWPDHPDVLGGRDLEAMGSWLAIDRRGRFAVVTNQPVKPPPSDTAPSRGQLVTDYLAGNRSSASFLERIAAQAAGYAGFCLVVGGPEKAFELREPNGGGPPVRAVQDIAVITNSPPGQEWAKSAWLREELRARLERKSPEPGELLALLERREPVLADESPAFSATPFIVNADYGTRASSLLMIDADGQCLFIERRFAAGGIPDGEKRFEFAVSPPGVA